jgi:hypothetical protein
MPRAMSRFDVRLGLTALLVLAVHATAQAEGKKYGELMKRLPEGANALMLIDVEGLLDSPMGKAEKWGDEVADRPAGPLGVTLDASKIAVAESLDPRTLEERWKLGMMQAKVEPPQISTLANREGGYVEEIETQKVVATPRGLYLFRFEPRIIGFLSPADRQFLVDWITQTMTKPRTFAPGWADHALFRADQGAQVVVAMNLKNAVSAREVETWARMLPGVVKNKLDPSILAGKLASVKSGFLQIDVTRGIRGTVEVEFDQDVEYAAPVAKEVVRTALEQVGARLGDDMENWSASVNGKTIKLEGNLDIPALRRILSAGRAPQMTSEYGSTAEIANLPPVKPGESATPVEPSEADVVKASQRYFRSIVDATDAIRQQRNQDWSHIRFWMDRSARQIDELPILFVDTELLDWGSQVSKTLREMAYGINYVNKDRAYRLASSPKGSYAGVGYGYAYAGTYVGADDRLMKTQSNAMISVGIDGTWKGIETSIGDMRKKMVAKYRVDF